MQTASQIMAAKRAAKQKLNIEKVAKQQIGNKLKERNKIANIKAQQSITRAHLKKGEPCDKDINITDEIRSWIHLQDLAYGHNSVSGSVFEKLIRAMRCVAKLYHDDKLSQVTNLAQAALERNYNEQDLSPNQRRALLKPIARLIEYAAAYAEVVPAKTVDYIASYCAAVQVALYSAAYFDTDSNIIAVLRRIIKGQSLRELSKSLGMKMPDLREQVLHSAYYLWRIAECFDEVVQPKYIPDLRDKSWLKWAEHDYQEEKIRFAANKWLIPFETATGISLINYHDFREKLTQIELKHTA